MKLYLLPQLYLFLIALVAKEIGTRCDAHNLLIFAIIFAIRQHVYFRFFVPEPILLFHKLSPVSVILGFLTPIFHRNQCELLFSIPLTKVWSAVYFFINFLFYRLYTFSFNTQHSLQWLN